jgi:hypothetical protein
MITYRYSKILDEQLLVSPGTTKPFYSYVSGPSQHIHLILHNYFQLRIRPPIHDVEIYLVPSPQLHVQTRRANCAGHGDKESREANLDASSFSQMFLASVHLRSSPSWRGIAPSQSKKTGFFGHELFAKFLKIAGLDTGTEFSWL